jgi:hypothetical protein
MRGAPIAEVFFDPETGRFDCPLPFRTVCLPGRFGRILKQPPMGLTNAWVFEFAC